MGGLNNKVGREFSGYLIRGHSIITFALSGGGVHENANVCKREGDVTSMQILVYIFLIEYLVHKLLAIVTRLFVSFIKIPVLLYKISVPKKLVRA